MAAGREREQQAAIFKTEWKTNLVARRVLRWRKSEESAIFQWSNKLQTVLKFSLCFPIECFSNHPQKCRDILNTTTLHFFFLEITWFCIPLWFCYHVWIDCNASPPCVINMKIFSHMSNLINFKRERINIRFFGLFHFCIIHYINPEQFCPVYYSNESVEHLWKNQ